jgi:hypothetical protein
MNVHKSTPTPWPGKSWLLYSIDGHITPCVDGEDWLTEWIRRVRRIEFGDGTPQQRCIEIDRLLTANASAFRATIQHGSGRGRYQNRQAPVEHDRRMSNRKCDHGDGDRNPALQWHPWLIDPGACRAASRFGIAVYVARPCTDAEGFDLYRAGMYLGRHFIVAAYQHRAEETEATFALIHRHIQMQYRYASDWTRQQAEEVVALVKAEVAAVPVLTDRWWICDDDALPDRPSVPCKFSVD